MALQDVIEKVECVTPIFHIYFLTYPLMKENYWLPSATSKLSPAPMKIVS
jgi:hypothetical protein